MTGTRGGYHRGGGEEEEEYRYSLEETETDDLETKRAKEWLRTKRISIPWVVSPDDGQVVYQNRFATGPEIALKLLPHQIKHFDRRRGLGPFAVLNYLQIRDFLDDYLSIRDILALACVSREMNFFCSDEKLWRRFARRMYKGNMDYRNSWKNSVIQWHNMRVCRRHGIDYQPLEIPRVVDQPPYWEGKGMEFDCVRAFKHWYRASCSPRYFELTCPKHLVDRREGLTHEEFINEYELKEKPVVLRGLAKEWGASRDWAVKPLVETFGETKFRTGGGFKMKMRRYFNYLDSQFEPQPLYLFDRNYPTRAPAMAAGYSIPPFFTEDLFKITGEDERPPYKWILIGPGGSGVPFHTDPRATSAWNTVLFGAKRWIMYPPGVQPPGVGPDNSDYYDAPTAIKWLLKVYPTLKEEQKPVECIQYAGDTIFIPSRWWHCVYNVGTPVNTAVTHNFASSQNFPHIVADLLSDEDDEFLKVFRAKLKKKRPQLYERFLQLEQEHQAKRRPTTTNDSAPPSNCSS